MNVGSGPCADGAAGVAGVVGLAAVSNSQLPLPLASVSSTISASISTSRLTLMLPQISGNNAPCASKRLICAICGREPHAAFENVTSSTATAGDRPIASLSSPLIAKSRPVACLA